MKIGIMGGTFNPIHFGHIFIANYILDDMKLDKIMFIPSGNPPHKKKESVIDKKYRKKMVELAIENNPKFILNSIECDTEGLSYTYDTVSFLKKKYPKDTFYYIIGQDAFFYLDSWYKAKELIKLIHFVVVRRGEPLKKEKIDFYSKWGVRMEFIRTPLLEISSTDIRQRIQSGRSIQYYLPEKVENYIIHTHLYLN